MLCAYWDLVLMSFHLGLHWSDDKTDGTPNLKGIPGRTAILRIASVMIAAYGLYAFVKRGIGTYLFLQTEFVFLILRSRCSFSLLITRSDGPFCLSWPLSCQRMQKLQSFKGKDHEKKGYFFICGGGSDCLLCVLFPSRLGRNRRGSQCRFLLP